MAAPSCGVVMRQSRTFRLHCNKTQPEKNTKERLLDAQGRPQTTQHITWVFAPPSAPFMLRVKSYGTVAGAAIFAPAIAATFRSPALHGERKFQYNRGGRQSNDKKTTKVVTWYKLHCAIALRLEKYEFFKRLFFYLNKIKTLRWIRSFTTDHRI